MKKVINAFIFQFIGSFPVDYFLHHGITLYRVVWASLIGTILMIIFCRKYIIKII